MKPRLVAILVVLVLCPLAGLAWVGARYARDEQADRSGPLQQAGDVDDRHATGHRRNSPAR